MKERSVRVLKSGNTLVTVELEPGEKLRCFSEDRFYSLGEPLMDEVLPGHMLSNAVPTVWCPVEQKWVY
jgi:hypothetical protein